MAGWSTGGFVVRNNRLNNPDYSGVAGALNNNGVGVNAAGGLSTVPNHVQIATALNNTGTPVTPLDTSTINRTNTPPPPGNPPPPGGFTPPAGAPTQGQVFSPFGTVAFNDPRLANLTWDQASQSYKQGTGTTTGQTPPPPGGTFTPPAGAPTSGQVLTPWGTAMFNDPKLASLQWNAAKGVYEAKTPATPGAGQMVGNTGQVRQINPYAGEDPGQYYQSTGLGGYGQSTTDIYANQHNLGDYAVWLKAHTGKTEDQLSPADQVRYRNSFQNEQTTAQNIQNQYDSPVGQAVQSAANALGPNAGEKAITQWMQGGPMDFGLAANSIDAQFRLGQFGGNLINAYMAGGGTRQVPIDFGGGMFGWTRDANGNYIKPEGDESGITWNSTTHRFEGDLNKATQYYMKGMKAGNGLMGSAGTLNRYVRPDGKTWNGSAWIPDQELHYTQAGGGQPPPGAGPTNGPGPTSTSDWLGNWWDHINQQPVAPGAPPPPPGPTAPTSPVKIDPKTGQPIATGN